MKAHVPICDTDSWHRPY